MNSGETLYTIPQNITTRWASPENPTGEKGMGGKAGGSRKGRASIPLKDKETLVLAREDAGSGVVRRFWATIDVRTSEMLRGLRLDFYWDGSDEPAVSVPFGDFFGVGLGECVPFESAYFTNPEGRSFCCYLPMPFKNGMKMTITNASGTDLPSLFYDIDYTMGDDNTDALYLHAEFNRRNPTTMREDYEILSKKTGKGRYIGCNIGVAANMKKYFNAWWGEGEVKVFLDGDEEYPTLCGTGTEDFIGTGWGQGHYAHLYQGCHLADHARFRYCFYRYHALDPIYFHRDIRVTIQQIGCYSPEVKPKFAYENAKILSTSGEVIDFAKEGGTPGYGLFEREDDWSSCAYYYLDRA